MNIRIQIIIAIFIIINDNGNIRTALDSYIQIMT